MAGPRWFAQPDIQALLFPIGFAMTGFTLMVGRAFVQDPEWSNGLAFYEKPEAAQIGQKYRTWYSQYFQGRSMSWIFDNAHPASQQ